MSSLRSELSSSKMDNEVDKAPVPAERDQIQSTDATTTLDPPEDEVASKPAPSVKRKCKACKSKKHKSKAKLGKGKDRRRKVAMEASASESSESGSSDDDSSESSSEDERHKSKASGRSRSSKTKSRRRNQHRKNDPDSEDESSDNVDSEESDQSVPRRKKKHTKKAKKAVSESEQEESESEEDKDDYDQLEEQAKGILTKISELRVSKPGTKQRRSNAKSIKSKSKSKSRKSDSSDYKRVDQLWDSETHNYKLRESAEDDEGEFAEYAFLVRRRFNWENKYQNTVIDIKSKVLRSVLAEVMKNCKSVTLEAEEPQIDPNLLFLYLEDLRTMYKKTLKARVKKEKKKKAIKKLKLQRKLCRALVHYIDEDYADIKKTLYPLLAAGNITFELLWALFTPNDIAITSCYGSWDDPRCFKVDASTKHCSMARGEWYCIDGKYLEYDGKALGFGDFEIELDAFKGPRKITSLAAYPLKYHPDVEKVKKQIIERGERFINMQGMQYKFHKGMAFMKKKNKVLRININGRIMVDPSTFRRINPNYPIALIKPREDEELFSDHEDDCSFCDENSDCEPADGNPDLELEDKDNGESSEPKYKYKWQQDSDGEPYTVMVEVDDDGTPIREQKKVTSLASDSNLQGRSFTQEQLLLTSPVVLGFAFSEKLWLEFTLSGVHEITYNEAAFDSLVLPPNQKSIVRALVESHKFHAAKTIDDVIQGKGKGLVCVLHGPPGTGKTLTAEGISELLKVPLYMVSAGELGTDPARLEQELQKILDIAHSWGAVLLLDEADVFLEKREVHDIHRNALVSIFLRLLEYFQGILFLTTNRVETFDDAFQSRIHVALRYGELTIQAKRSVWKMFLEMVRKSDDSKIARFSEQDIESLARHSLNGRQIKNMVRTAQALAVNEQQTLTMDHIRRVLDVAETFDRDLKGGTGYIDAMRSYT